MHGKTMREALQEARDYRDDTNEGGPGSGPQKGGKKQSSADIKKAYGILNDPRYKQGNYSGAAKAIDKLSPGLSNHPDVKNAMKRANEESQITEKKAEFLRLDFKNKNEVEKLEGWMYKFISQVNAPYDSVVFNKHRLDGFSVEFEGMDDADALMTKLKRAGFRFKVDMRENLDLPATGDTTTSNASQELKEIVESIDDDTLIQIAESNGMGKLIVLDEDGNLANRDELLELAPLAVLATIARLAPAAVKVAKKAAPVIKKGISTAKDAITKYANKLDTPKAQPKPNLSKTDRAAVIPSRTNTGQKLDFSKSIKKQQKGFQKNLRKGIPNEQVEEIVEKIIPGQLARLKKEWEPLRKVDMSKRQKFIDQIKVKLKRLNPSSLSQIVRADIFMVSDIAKELMKEEIDEAVVGLPFSRTLMYIIKTDRNTAKKIKSFLADNGEKYPIHIDDNGSGQITLDAYNYTGGEKKAALAAAQAIAKKFNVKVNATR